MDLFRFCKAAATFSRLFSIHKETKWLFCFNLSLWSKYSQSKGCWKIIPSAYRLIPFYSVIWLIPGKTKVEIWHWGIVFPGHYPQVTVEELEELWQRSQKGRMIETEVHKQAITWWRARRCCVKVCSPFDLCFPRPPGLETVQNRTTVSNKTCKPFNTPGVLLCLLIALRSGFQGQIGTLNVVFFCFGH